MACKYIEGCKNASGWCNSNSSLKCEKYFSLEIFRLNHELSKYQSAFYQACEQLALLNEGQNTDWIDYFMRRVEGHLYE